MSDTQHKSYRLTSPLLFSLEESALFYASRFPKCTFQIEKLEAWDVDFYRIWEIVFHSPRCPSCGRYSGTTDPGMPDPKKQGGAEHICWKCAEMFKPWIIREMYSGFREMRAQ